MIIHESATLLTDYLLALLGGCLAWRLHRRIDSDQPAVRWWIRALVAMSVSAFVGGSYHGFAPNLAAGLAAVWWRFVLVLVCAIGLCLGASLIREIVPVNRQRGWNGLLVAKFMLSVVVVMIYPKFLLAMLDYGLAMIAWAVAALFCRRAWSGWMLAAVGMSAVAGWVQQSGWGVPDHLDHNAVYHLIQVLALFGFYQGGRQLGRSQ